MVCSAARAAPHVLLALALAFFLALALSGFDRPVVGQPEEPPDEEDGARDAEPTTYPIGVYVTSLHDFDTTEGTFGADYWIWSVHPPGPNPLESIEFVNAKEVDTDLNHSEELGDMLWSQRKVSTVTRHDWDLADFPFDRQMLEIQLEEGATDTEELLYEADSTNSGYNKDMNIDGWRITDFEVQERSVNYDTTFGDPSTSENGGSSYARLAVLIELERDSFSGFFKLIAGVYAAIAIMLVSFLMSSELPPIFSGRIIMLVGALFSTVVNMQVGEAALGRPEYITLVSEIHIVALLFIFGAAVMAVFSRRTSESGKPELAKRRDRISLLVFGVSFALVNVALILAAVL